MALSRTQLKHLRSLAHHIKPVILTGANGITDAVINEINIALDAHELIKVKVRAEDKDERSEMVDRIVDVTGAEKVNLIGHNLTLYRQSKDNHRIDLPK